MLKLPKGITATIETIKPDKKLGKAGVRVLVNVRGQSRTKDFVVKLDGATIDFYAFKVELEKSVKADMEKDAEIARALKDLTDKVGKPFDLFDYIPSTHTKKNRGKV